MSITFLSLGTNLGNKESNLDHAIEKIEEYIGRILMYSSIYETEPWGFQAKNEFLNMVLKVETDLIPSELLEKVLNIESLLGRVRANKHYTSAYSSRVIDIDILMYDNIIINEPDLKIPHPLMHERKFVLVPLCEIAPDMIHPVLKKSFSSLLEICLDTGEVTRHYA
jgi:2-amino-4-hydroxy-6-hydroxymethyldihydropteridine diphosphokinase